MLTCTAVGIGVQPPQRSIMNELKAGAVESQQPSDLVLTS